MKIQKNYPEEFTGLLNRKYKLIKVYDHFALYENPKGLKTCFNMESIKSEIRRSTHDNSRRAIQI